jgi:hypothetical protein
VHRLLRTETPFSCALSGGSPDSYCALSGVHWIGTVDCPVRPYPVFKKTFPSRARGQALFPLCSLPPSRSQAISTLTCDLPSPAAILRRHCACPALLPLVSSCAFTPPLFSLIQPSGAPSSHLLRKSQISVNSCETKLWYVCLCVP